MATVTLGNAGQPESVHVGINTVICKISLSASWSSGDVHRIGRIPQGAIPLDAVFYPGPAVAGATVSKFGTSASQELFFASATYSAALYRTTRNFLGSRAQISLGDDARVLYDWITAVFTSGASVGHIGDLVVHYKMPGQTL